MPHEMTLTLALSLLAMLPLLGMAEPAPTAPGNPVVIIETSKGTITAELWPDHAPETVASFLKYVDASFYDGVIFHRVIPGFMVQGGGFLPGMKQKQTGTPVKNEAKSDVGNKRGTLAMARTSDPHSATAQFFINLVDNAFLDHKSKTPRGYGYCVFGKVIDGMDTVDAMAKVPTGQNRGHGDVPVNDIVITSIRRKK